MGAAVRGLGGVGQGTGVKSLRADAGECKKGRTCILDKLAAIWVQVHSMQLTVAVA